MSIRIKWPEEGWPEEINEKVRSKLQEVIRNAMNNNNNNNNNRNSKTNSKNNSTSNTPPPSSPVVPGKQQNSTSSPPTSNSPTTMTPNNTTPTTTSNNNNDDEEDEQEQPLSALMRGKVSVDGLSLGRKAPKIILKRIIDLSPGRSGLLIHIEYKGDAWVSLRGIEINLDPTRVFVTGGGGLSGGRKAEVVAPFFCPLTLKLSNFHLQGDIKIEISHEKTVEVEDDDESTEEEYDHSDDDDDEEQQQEDENQLEEDGDENEKNSKKKKKKRKTTTKTFVPDTFTEMFLGKIGGNNNNGQIKRKLFIQLMSEDEFLTDFNVESNFVPVPSAVETIKKVIRAAAKPFFQKLRSQGMSVQL